MWTPRAAALDSAVADAEKPVFEMPASVDIGVPDPEATAALKALVLQSSAAAGEVLDQMIWCFGGEPRCFERFLLATNSDVAAAHERFQATLAFRAEHSLHRGLDVWPDQTIIERVRPFWPIRVCSASVDGSPVQFVPIGAVDVRSIMSSLTEEELCHFYIWWMESSLARQRELNPTGTSSRDWKGNIEIYDMEMLSIWQIHVSGLRLLSRVLSIGQAHYPESLRKQFIINTPRLFSAAWATVSMVLSERTLAKVTISSDASVVELEELLGGKAALQAVQLTEERGW